MALMLHSSAPSLATKKPHLLLLLHSPPHNLCSHSKPRNLTIKAQDPSSSSSNSSQSQKPTESTPTSSSSAVSKKPNSDAGLGFGASNSANSNVTNPVASKKKQKGKKERASIIRRVPVEKPSFASENEEIRAKSQNESAFLLAWLGLGGIILVEGIALAASGFLPEEWDNLFVKYLYPSFTPTVFLFLAGTVAYGVLKYLQNEKFKSDS